MEEKTAAGGASQATGCFFCGTAKPFIEQLFTDATCDHFRNSRIEFLKGVRSFIDDRIAYLSRQANKRTGTHVTVE